MSHTISWKNPTQKYNLSKKKTIKNNAYVSVVRMVLPEDYLFSNPFFCKNLLDLTKHNYRLLTIFLNQLFSYINILLFHYEINIQTFFDEFWYFMTKQLTGILKTQCLLYIL
jgi:hypothetical protein